MRIPARLKYHQKQEIISTLFTHYQKKKKAYTDQTGRFPHQSARGNNYFSICYDYDTNAILATIKNRETEIIIAA